MNSDFITHLESLSSYIPIDITTLDGFLKAVFTVCFFVLVRYVIIVVPAFYLFWSKRVASGYLLHDQIVPPRQIKNEIKWSMLSTIIFALSGTLIGVLWQLGLNKIYLRLDYISYYYLPASFLILALMHEAYFYFTHVWMHKPKIYRIMHAVHHQSIKTSPWASFSFHPLEALVHAFYLPMATMILPVHPTTLILYLTFMTLTAVSNHLGIELISSKIIRNFFISGEHHFFHHQKPNKNFGLYFTFMDKLMKTNFRQKMNKESI